MRLVPARKHCRTTIIIEFACDNRTCRGGGGGLHSTGLSRSVPPGTEEKSIKSFNNIQGMKIG
jgi:hypothetical protein